MNRLAIAVHGTLVILGWALSGETAVAGQTRFVDSSQLDINGDGLSWSTAHRDLQAALAVASSGDEIWIRRGVYYPTEGLTDVVHPRSVSFQMKEGVSIYGGFTGSEQSVAQRPTAPFSSVVIFSGDIDHNDLNSDGNYISESPTMHRGINSHHVVRGASGALLDRVTITGGSALFSGGGLYNISASPTISHCRFIGNSAGRYGGAVANPTEDRPIFSNCLFEENLAIQGGAVYNGSFSRTSFSGCVFVRNKATNDGGSIYQDNFSESHIIDCQFVESIAKSGGGGIRIDSNGSVFLSDSRFESNRAESYGGAILNGGFLGAVGATFNSCSAVEANGGSISSFGECFLNKCSFQNSMAGRFGGAISTNHSGPLFASNSLFIGNSAVVGSAVYSANGPPNHLANCTVVGNTAGPIYAWAASGVFFEITNTVIWGNDPESGFALQAVREVEFLISHSLIEGLAAGDPGNLDGTQVENNPQFVFLPDHSRAPVTPGNLRLLPTSPLIDRGLALGTLGDFDLDNNLRVTGTAIDIGAYERLADEDMDGLPDVFETLNSVPASTIGTAPGADLDGDGATALEEFLYGSSDLIPDLTKHPEGAIVTDNSTAYLGLSFQVSPQALPYASYTVERSTTLGPQSVWTTDQVLQGVDPGDLSVSARSTIPVQDQVREFLRVTVLSR